MYMANTILQCACGAPEVIMVLLMNILTRTMIVYIIRTMNTKHTQTAARVSCSKMHTRLYSVDL